MSNEHTGFCTECGRHCPVTDLQCGRGRRLFGIEGDECPSRRETGQEPLRHGHSCQGKGHGHGQCCRHGDQDRGDHNCHGKGHGHGQCCRHGRDTFRSDLPSMLSQCGNQMMKHPGRGRGQGKILRILAEKKSISQRQLQEILDIQPGSLSEILTKLESKGLILREKCDEDRRAVVVRITPAGEAAAEQHLCRGGQGDPLACLTQEEQTILRGLLEKLLAAWHRDESQERPV